MIIYRYPSGHSESTFLVFFVADVPTTTTYSVDNASSSGTEENSDGRYS